jgi:hypothetical protein
MTLRRLLPALALLIVLGLVAWRLVREDPETPAGGRGATTTGSAAGAAEAEPGGDPREPTPRPGESSGATPGAPGARAPLPAGATDAAATKQPPGATAPRAGEPPGEGAARAPEKKSGDDQGLVDQTGWGKNTAAQLNRELMPLVNECVDQALARNPKLRGSLALDVTVAPMNDPLHKDRAIIEAVKEASRNKVEDAELVECIRQSSFAIEGLEAPYNFTLGIPINVEPAHK